MKKKALFVDRDGTMIAEPLPDRQIDTLEKLSFIPGVIRGLYKLRTMTDFELVMVSNQDGLGTESFPLNAFSAPHEKMLDVLRGEGIAFDTVLIDPSLPGDRSPNRKPGTGMMRAFLGGDYDLDNCWVIGDRLSDTAFARNLGCRSIHFTSGAPDSEADFFADSWDEICAFLLSRGRLVTFSRTTAETSIDIRLNPDGRGETAIQTGIGFFDHMLDQLGRHSGCDITLTAAGDLHVDSHHTIEDTGLALGSAFAAAVGDGRGIRRYGFYLPMDECSCRAALDLSGRPCLVWKARFTREMIGDMPTEMFRHFFKSFTDACGCTLHIFAEGENEHHKIESIFKAVARALGMAVKRDTGTQTVPSTKGVLT